MEQVRLLVDGQLYLVKVSDDESDTMMEEGGELSQTPSTTLELDIPQFKVRQALSREIYKAY